MRKYGESKMTRIMMQLYRTSLPVRDLEYFRPMDFCSTECTYIKILKITCLYILDVFFMPHKLLNCVSTHEILRIMTR